jgi:AcrR family transcriptional regulator
MAAKQATQAGQSAKDAAGANRTRAREAAREAKTELYQKLVLEAAEQVFAAKGYDEAKIGEIAETSGVSLQTLYSVFPGKAAIYNAVHEVGDQALHQRAIDCSAAQADPLLAMLAGLRAVTVYFLEHPDFLRMRLHGGYTWGTEASAAGDLGRSEAWRAAIDMLESACRRLIADGVLVERDPGLMARLMVAMQQVELAHWLQGGMASAPDDVADALARQVARAFHVAGG